MPASFVIPNMAVSYTHLANSIRSVEDKSQPASAFMETNIVYASPHDTIVDILELVNKYQLKTCLLYTSEQQQ